MNKYLHIALSWVLEDMQEQRLQVVLIPAPEPQHPTHMVRNAITQNPEWYRELCKTYETHRTCPRKRKHPDTRLKRRNIIRILERLISVGSSSSKYTEDLLKIAEEYYQTVLFTQELNQEVDCPF